MCIKYCFNNNQMLDKNIPRVHYFDTRVYSFFFCVMSNVNFFRKENIQLYRFLKRFFFLFFLFFNILVFIF